MTTDPPEGPSDSSTPFDGGQGPLGAGASREPPHDQRRNSPLPPFHVTISCLALVFAAALLLVFAFFKLFVDHRLAGYVWLWVLLNSLLVIIGSVRFFFCRSVKILMPALILGILVHLDALRGLAVLPVPRFVDKSIGRVPKAPSESSYQSEPSESSYQSEPSESSHQSEPIVEFVRVMDHKMIAELMVLRAYIPIYVVFLIYLMSPPVKRYIARESEGVEASISHVGPPPLVQPAPVGTSSQISPEQSPASLPPSIETAESPESTSLLDQNIEASRIGLEEKISQIQERISELTDRCEAGRVGDASLKEDIRICTEAVHRADR